MNAKLAKVALQTIGRTTSLDFSDTDIIAWGQWCRSIADAALLDDADEVERLRRQVEPETKKET